MIRASLLRVQLWRNQSHWRQGYRVRAHFSMSKKPNLLVVMYSIVWYGDWPSHLGKSLPTFTAHDTRCLYGAKGDLLRQDGGLPLLRQVPFLQIFCMLPTFWYPTVQLYVTVDPGAKLVTCVSVLGTTGGCTQSSSVVTVTLFSE